jgi:hypothetical protein
MKKSQSSRRYILTIVAVYATIFLAGTIAQNRVMEKARPKIFITESGIFANATSHTASQGGPGPNSLAGIHVLQSDTRDIPLQKGISFGIKFLLVYPQFQEFRLIPIMLHPPFQDNTDDDPRVSSMGEVDVLPGQGTYIGWKFGEADHMLAGEWQFELWYQGSKLTSETFRAYKP